MINIENERYLGDMIGNTIKEDITFGKILETMEKLSEQRLEKKHSHLWESNSSKISPKNKRKRAEHKDEKQNL